MALNKHFKVRDTITVGQSGLFGNTVQIGTSDQYMSVDPAIDAWGPILSGGRDLSLFIGDGIDRIRETVVAGGTVTPDGVLTVRALAEAGGLQSTFGTPTQNAGNIGWDVVPAVDSGVVTIPSLAQTTDGGDTEAPYQGTIQIRTQNDGSGLYDGAEWVSNGNWSTIEALGLQGYDSPIFTNLTLSGDGYASGSATLSAANTFYIDPKNDGDNAGTVIIKGNFQVDGVTTTINSTTLTVDDLNVVLASGAANKAAANGAGITVDGADATITYTSADDKWNTNKGLVVTGALSASGNTELDGTLNVDGATTINNSLSVIGSHETNLGGTLKVASSSDLNGTLNVEGITTLQDNLLLSGAGFFHSALSAASTLHVDGETTLASAIVEDLTNDKMVVAGAGGALENSIVTATDTKVTVGGQLSATGNTELDGTLTLTGGADFNDVLAVSGVTTLQDELLVSGAGFFHSALSAADTLHVDGQSTLASVAVEDLTEDKIVVVGANGELEDSIVTATGSKVTVSGDLSATGNTTLNGTVNIDSATTLESTVEVQDSITQKSEAGSAAFTTTDVISGRITDSDSNWIALCPATVESFKAIVIAKADTGTDKTVLEILGMPLANGTDVNGTVYGEVDAAAGVFDTSYIVTNNLSANTQDGLIYLNVAHDGDSDVDGNVTIHLQSFGA